MSTFVQPPCDHKKEDLREFTTWYQSNKDALVGIGIAIVVMASGALALVLMNWSAVAAVAPFGLGCTLLTGCIAFIGNFLIKLGERRGATAHLITIERIAELMTEVAELRTETRKDFEQVATATAEFMREMHRVTNAGADEVAQHRLRYHGE